MVDQHRVEAGDEAIATLRGKIEWIGSSTPASLSYAIALTAGQWRAVDAALAASSAPGGEDGVGAPLSGDAIASLTNDLRKAMERRRLAEPGDDECAKSWDSIADVMCTDVGFNGPLFGDYVVSLLNQVPPPAVSQPEDPDLRGLVDAAHSLLGVCIEDFGLDDDDRDDEAVARGEDGDVAVTFGHMRRLKTALARAAPLTPSSTPIDPCVDRERIAEAINRARYSEDADRYLTLAESTDRDRWYCYKLADAAILALHPQTPTGTPDGGGTKDAAFLTFLRGDPVCPEISPLSWLRSMIADCRERLAADDLEDPDSYSEMISEVQGLHDTAVEAIRFLKSAAGEDAGDGWQPIETAPERKLIETMFRQDKATRVLQRTGRMWWAGDLAYFVNYEPTHWRPLPAPPPGPTEPKQGEVGR